MEDPKVAIAAIQERLVSLNDKATSLHGRVDKVEMLIREELKEINSSFKDVSKELKDVVAWMNRGKGWAAAAFFAASAIGGLITTLIGKFL